MHKQQQGQTLLEVIIAGGIVVVALISILSLTVSGMNTSRQSENNLIAMNLAREGIEVIRSLRDSNWLSNDVWSLGLLGVTLDGEAIPVYSFSENRWSLNFSPDSFADSATVLYINDNGMYAQEALIPGNAQKTIFSRLLFIEANSEQTSLRVTSTVRWQEKSRMKEIKLISELWNWK
jgi:type II secretory pathway pseudopilin PulG